MKLKLTRRRFLAAAFIGVPAAALADAACIEPEWINVRRIRLSTGVPKHQLLHFTDLHHKGDKAYLASMVRKINSLSPDAVCFTGDLIEEKEYLDETLELLAGIKSPLYGVPGNHDYWSNAPFKPIARCFEKTGGAWLLDQAAVCLNGRVNIIGASCASAKKQLPATRPDARNVLLVHYPAWVKQLGSSKYDLILAGHSHGGQVRIPFYGPLVTPFGVDEYDLGLFQTPAGPLYVNPGIGWFYAPLRFRCRPELTVFEL